MNVGKMFHCALDPVNGKLGYCYMYNEAATASGEDNVCQTIQDPPVDQVSPDDLFEAKMLGKI